MRASDSLAVTSGSDGRSFVLTAMGGRLINFIGSSAPVTVPPGSMGIQSFGICQDEGRDIDVVAISIPTGNLRDGRNWIDFMIEVRKEGDKHVINLTDPWIPMNGRLGQVVGNDMVVNLNGEWFTTKGSLANGGTGRYLPNSNRVCAYLAGHITEVELLKDAEEVVIQTTALALLERARGDLERLRQDKRNLEQRQEELEAETQGLKATNEELVKQNADLRNAATADSK